MLGDGAPAGGPGPAPVDGGESGSFKSVKTKRKEIILAGW